MENNELEEHIYKETLKKIVDNGNRYTQNMKEELKALIDGAHSDRELCKLLITYFADKNYNLF